MRKLILTLLTVFLVLGLNAQTRTVTGKVTDERGEPLAGATVVAGSSYAVTDLDGQNTLS